jgi:hypothetical protein
MKTLASTERGQLRTGVTRCVDFLRLTAASLCRDISEFKSVSRAARSIAACTTLNADACLRAIAATISAAVERFGLLAAMAILVPITEDNAVPEAEDEITTERRENPVV